jgi:hypothetical protein
MKNFIKNLEDLYYNLFFNEAALDKKILKMKNEYSSLDFSVGINLSADIEALEKKLLMSTSPTEKIKNKINLIRGLDNCIMWHHEYAVW